MRLAHSLAVVLKPLTGQVERRADPRAGSSPRQMSLQCAAQSLPPGPCRAHSCPTKSSDLLCAKHWGDFRAPGTQVWTWRAEAHPSPGGKCRLHTSSWDTVEVISLSAAQVMSSEGTSTSLSPRMTSPPTSPREPNSRRYCPHCPQEPLWGQVLVVPLPAEPILAPGHPGAQPWLPWSALPISHPSQAPSHHPAGTSLLPQHPLPATGLCAQASKRDP